MRLSDLRQGFKLSELDVETAAEKVAGFLSWLQDNLDGIQRMSPRVARELVPVTQRLATVQSLLEEGDFDAGD